MTIEEEIRGLQKLSVGDLRIRFLELYGRPHPPHIRRDLLQQAVAYRIQEVAQGGPDLAQRDRLARLGDELKRDGRIRVRLGPGIKPGTRLMREWQGETHVVTVTAKAFHYDGNEYRSLSVIARLITGTRWSGPAFFGTKDRA